MAEALPPRFSVADPPADDRPTPAPAPEPLLLSARDLAAMLRLGLRTIRSLDSAGRLPRPLRITPGCVRWRYDEIRAWLDAGAPCRQVWARLRAARK